MLVTFTTEAHENITMFGEVAIALIKLMGHSGKIPSALSAKDVPVALDRLKKALAKSKPDGLNNLDEEEPPISLAQRAWPLINLLEDAAEKERPVLWTTR